jgi:hypothetical protein
VVVGAGELNQLFKPQHAASARMADGAQTVNSARATRTFWRIIIAGSRLKRANNLVLPGNGS